MKFIATATRKNVGGKPDYQWVFCHANGNPVTFSTETEALDRAQRICAETAHALYNPKAEPINN